jgi:molybdenum cofactor guanylyltransferase
MSVAAAILAGGGGTRMGEGVVKGLLSVGGQRIIDRQLAVLRPLFAEVVIAANDPDPWAGMGLRIVPDRIFSDRGTPLGPIAGLDAVLATLPPSVDAVLCVAGDMPFLAASLLQHLRDAVPTAAALVPRIAGRAEPLLARYARSVSPVVADQIAAGRYAVVDLLARLGGSVVWIEESELRALDPALRSTANVNTPADLAALARVDPTPRS